MKKRYVILLLLYTCNVLLSMKIPESTIVKNIYKDAYGKMQAQRITYNENNDLLTTKIRETQFLISKEINFWLKVLYSKVNPQANINSADGAFIEGSRPFTSNNFSQIQNIMMFLLIPLISKTAGQVNSDAWFDLFSIAIIHQNILQHLLSFKKSNNYDRAYQCLFEEKSNCAFIPLEQFFTLTEKLINRANKRANSDSHDIQTAFDNILKIPINENISEDGKKFIKQSAERYVFYFLFSNSDSNQLMELSKEEIIQKIEDAKKQAPTIATLIDTTTLRTTEDILPDSSSEKNKIQSQKLSNVSKKPQTPGQSATSKQEPTKKNRTFSWLSVFYRALSYVNPFTWLRTFWQWLVK